MELLKEYIYKAFDFSGEETQKDYKNMCLFTGGLYITCITLLDIVSTIPIAGGYLALLILACILAGLFCFAAATFRRCGSTGRSKWWCIVCVLAGFLSPAVLFLFLGRD